MLINFYVDVLGMKLETFRGTRSARVSSAARRSTAHEWGAVVPRAHVAVPGSLDLCFIASIPLEQVIQKLKSSRIPILEGPVAKTGAMGPMQSVYVRDPDLNLVEISEYRK
jgi:catechol 2,3-dioxygenase-like lactoylglutathione lyase family enzyme